MKTKTCCACKLELTLEAFAKKGNGLQSRCKECQKKYAATHYQKNKQSYKDRSKNSRPNLIKRNRDYIYNYKLSKGCCKCPEREPIALDLHHVDSEEKEHGISKMVNESRSIQSIKTEVNKCIVICSNCHRKLHAGLIKI